MIVLITGTPGAGKTLNTLELVEKENPDRNIYYRGIKELSLPWTELSDDECLHWWDQPAGSVFVFDEVQDIWPNVSNNKPSPDSVIRLDKHRHSGFDFYIITQMPTLVDFRARKFVDRHIHFERANGLNGTRRIEWPHCESNPRDYHARQEADIKRVKLNKKYFDKYKSAEIHTVKPRIPRQFYYFLLALIFALGAFYYVFQSIMSRQDEAPIEASQLGTPLEHYAQSMSNLRSRSNDDLSYSELWTPRVPDLPYSAPAYDEVTEVKTYPRPQCVEFLERNICRCYTQQATPLTISDTQCRNMANNGWFNPFREDGVGGEVRQAESAGSTPDPTPAPSEHPYATVLGDDSGSGQPLQVKDGYTSGLPPAVLTGRRLTNRPSLL